MAIPVITARWPPRHLDIIGPDDRGPHVDLSQFAADPLPLWSGTVRGSTGPLWESLRNVGTGPDAQSVRRESAEHSNDCQSPPTLTIHSGAGQRAHPIIATNRHPCLRRSASACRSSCSRPTPRSIRHTVVSHTWPGHHLRAFRRVDGRVTRTNPLPAGGAGDRTIQMVSGHASLVGGVTETIDRAGSGGDPIPLVVSSGEDRCRNVIAAAITPRQ